MTRAAARSRRSVIAVTPVFNRRELTLACLCSMFASDLDGIDLRAIVVDDGSTDGTAEALAVEFPDVTVIRADGSLWYSEATNVGVRRALEDRPDYILIYNNDSLFPPDCLARLVSVAETYPTSLVGPALVKWDDRKTIFQTATRWQTNYGGWRTIGPQTVDDLPDLPFPVETFPGNCVLVPTAAFLDAGLMNSAKLPNFGDSELAARMRRRGWRLILDPAARLLCEPNAVPRRLSSMSIPELYEALWTRRTSYHNLKQRHAANMGGAPRPWKGCAATAFFVGRLTLKFIGLGGSWPNNWPEGRLRDSATPLADIQHVEPGKGRWIVYAWPYVEWGGIQVYMLQLMKSARARGYTVAAAIPRHHTPVQLDMVRASADYVWLIDDHQDNQPAPTFLRKLKRRRNNARAEQAWLRTILASAPPDAIVHIDAGPWGSPGLLRALAARHHVVMTVHTGLQPLKGHAYRRWRRGFDTVMANPRFHLLAANGEARRSLAPYLEASRLDQVHISQTSFDPDNVRLAAAKQDRHLDLKLGLKRSSFRIVVGAQFIERKGYKDLLEALLKLSQRGVAVDCLWLCPSLPAPDVLEVLRKLPYAGLLDIRQQTDIGPTHVEYLAAIASLADAFVLPSHLEGLPLAIVEAMALGVPCIATAINAVPEALHHGRTGLLVSPRDPDGLADAIEKLAGDAALRSVLGDNARNFAFERYALPIAVTPTLTTYSAAEDAG